MRPRRAAGLCLAVAAVLAGGGAFAGSADLEPYQMVRSLQLVQDRLANGDNAALPMQRKLLELIDARMAAGSPSDFDDRRNLDALLIYGMSGGNPTTLEIVLSKLDLDDRDKKLGDGIVDYLKGRATDARQTLTSVDPHDFQPELGAFLALVEGSISAKTTPQKALALFDLARLLCPGTLIEEAALRRSVALAASQKNAARFLTSSEQYARRFIVSPYASQFAVAFVDGVVALHAEIDLKAVGEIIGEMNPEQQRTIYLRIARQAVVGGLDDLLSYCTAALARIDKGSVAPEDPREELYSSIGSLTSASVSDIKTKLAAIDRSRLSADDRQLLDAAEAVAAAITALPREGVDASLKAASLEPDQPAGEPGPPDTAAGQSPQGPSDLQNPSNASTASAATPDAAAPSDQARVVEEAEGKMEAIDKLLQEADK